MKRPSPPRRRREPRQSIRRISAKNREVTVQTAGDAVSARYLRLIDLDQSPFLRVEHLYIRISDQGEEISVAAEYLYMPRELIHP